MNVRLNELTFTGDDRGILRESGLPVFHKINQFNHEKECIPFIVFDHLRLLRICLRFGADICQGTPGCPRSRKICPTQS
jgi:hypothetical protein